MSNLAREIINGVGYGQPRKELIDGIWCMSPGPSFNHHEAALNIGTFFRRHLKGKRCKAFVDSLDLHLSETEIFIPDVMVVCNPDIIKQKGIYGPPDLIAEVLSSSSIKHDRITKKAAYERHGVKEYWIVDTEHKSIEVFVLKEGKYVADNVYTLYPEDEIEDMTEAEKADIVYEFKTSLFDDFTIDIREIFEDIE